MEDSGAGDGRAVDGEEVGERGGVDERAALALVGDLVDRAGDDAAVVGDAVLTTDMLHDRTDFPAGTTRYTAGWRSVAASLSDVAAMGAGATAAVAVYAAPAFVPDELSSFVEGARDVCAAVDAEYVGGDLDTHREFTVATTALGHTEDPVPRSGASPGEAVCVTGTLGRSAAALRLFGEDPDRANDLFRFTPRVAAGRAVADAATAMMDVSDGLARSLHQLSAASDCGFAVESDAVPVDPAVEDVAEGPEDRLAMATAFGEDFELLFTVPEGTLSAVRESAPVPVAVLGETVPADRGVTMDGDPLPDEGYVHGEG
ncbi:thiamine-phosphate kinase [Halobacteriales archaeon QS_8_69_26]|nr:MAG: thiamine-phosphate kinase [Halobacteriales archaeon QS_8_69_26]